jgi:hypothetical protein
MSTATLKGEKCRNERKTTLDGGAALNDKVAIEGAIKLDLSAKPGRSAIGCSMKTRAT